VAFVGNPDEVAIQNAPEELLAPDEFLGASEISTVGLSPALFCFCLQGVNCCGDPGIEFECGTAPGCICLFGDCVELIGWPSPPLGPYPS